MLATESGGRIPNTVGAVLVLTGGSNLDIDRLQQVIAERTWRLPRMRQRLVRVPVGCGRPVWVDDPQFDLARHLRRQSCPAPGDEQALLAVAATVCARALPSSRPRWAAVLVSGLAQNKVALILVLHHVLADGIGGLAVLASLMDGVGSEAGYVESADHRAAPGPGVRELAIDAMHSRWSAIRTLPAVLRQLPDSFRSAGGLQAPPAGDCSLLQPTGPRRQFAVARADLGTLGAGARAGGATVNDALLAATAAALRVQLASRGERLDTFRITVPVAGRHQLPCRPSCRCSLPVRRPPVYLICPRPRRDRRHRHSLRPSTSIRPANAKAASQPASGISWRAVPMADAQQTPEWPGGHES